MVKHTNANSKCMSLREKIILSKIKAWNNGDVTKESSRDLKFSSQSSQNSKFIQSFDYESNETNYSNTSRVCLKLACNYY